MVIQTLTWTANELDDTPHADYTPVKSVVIPVYAQHWEIQGRAMDVAGAFRVSTAEGGTADNGVYWSSKLEGTTKAQSHETVCGGVLSIRLDDLTLYVAPQGSAATTIEIRYW